MKYRLFMENIHTTRGTCYHCNLNFKERGNRLHHREGWLLVFVSIVQTDFQPSSGAGLLPVSVVGSVLPRSTGLTCGQEILSSEHLGHPQRQELIPSS